MVEVHESPLEEAVYNNDMTMTLSLIKEGHEVKPSLQIGEMSCLEYCAMRGYEDILRTLLQHSINAAILRQYFSLNDAVERAFLLSKNKQAFLNRGALAEANRYEASLYTAAAYNQQGCLRILTEIMSPGFCPEDRRHSFCTEGKKKERLSAPELARRRGASECEQILANSPPKSST